MSLDIYTLFVCELYVLGFLSIIMVFAWVGSHYDRVLGFTCLSLVFTLIAVFLSSLRSSGLHFLPVAVGNVLVMLAYGGLLNAFRRFCGKPIGTHWLLGALLWALLCCFPAFYYSLPKRVLVLCIACVAYTAALIQLVWQARDTLKATFWPAQLLLWIHLLFHLVRLFLDSAIPSTLPGAIGGSDFSVYVILESILFVIGLTFTILAMVNERMQIALKYSSLHDPLTSVWNRRALFAEAEKIVARCRRQNRPFSAILFDLDHFKSINDRYGHHQGDQILIHFCEIVRGLIPAEGRFARLGGEEFAAIIPAGARDAEAWCEAIRLAVCASQPNEIAYSVSIGFATVTHSQQDFVSLLAMADAALYHAKASGRNCTAQHPVPAAFS
ncbi:GGDEF domain-containing protein [Pantoea sp. B550]|uniref:GGDEF domain-containing protein n=1 Tax=unclassified Pantoea TaxID=2630326 RepID=UPI001377C153|nr:MULTISPECIES: GGDEF domain-containing protein [Pantoea]MCP1207750.1 GGDEF domain-containing protein [Pantoea sp. B550]MCT2417029.1 GGDEF domain-containing protein [Pantoea sp. XY16]NBB56043.1 diguanylate cyclase [Pantoea vagans]